MRKSGERTQKFRPVRRGNNRAYFIVTRAKMRFDGFDIFVDLVNSLTGSGITSLDFNQHPAPTLIPRQDIDEAPRPYFIRDILLDIQKR